MKTMLIVDDHTSFRSSARALLEADGFTVVGEAEDGRTALEAVASLDPDVVLLDIGLPDTDGFAIAAAIAARHPRSRIVLTSSREPASFGARLAESAHRRFVAKDEISGQALRRLLGR